MFARKIVPILLVAGAVHMVMHRNQQRCESNAGEQPAEGERQHTHLHGPFGMRGPRGDWANRVPPMFEMLHNRAHAAQAAQAAQSATQQPPAAAPAI